jgi:predicted Zn-dependent protease
VVEYCRASLAAAAGGRAGSRELTPELDERFARQVLLGKDRTVNAFALPGGWLGPHSGLMRSLSTATNWPPCSRTNSAT